MDLMLFKNQSSYIFFFVSSFFPFFFSRYEETNKYFSGNSVKNSIHSAAGSRLLQLLA
ncbi:hypothetical protein SD77_1503 [Bacillus badius]|uniref:Uncharacterized protein n=1 Tax=Bacillus badius TaxID=1455 RepID=A0ABR5ARZ9_BACBA|nr:hypothetical protein SD77_1503 [Bacillus badius]